MVLETRRLTLRDFRPPDVASLAEYHANPRYLEHFDTPPNTMKIVSDAQDWALELPRRNYQLAICFAPDGMAIGSVGLRTRGHSEGEADVGFELDPTYWGHGYGSEALSALLNYGATELLVTRFSAISAPSNTRARRVLAALRFENARSIRGGVLFVRVEPAA